MIMILRNMILRNQTGGKCYKHLEEEPFSDTASARFLVGYGQVFAGVVSTYKSCIAGLSDLRAMRYPALSPERVAGFRGAVNEPVAVSLPAMQQAFLSFTKGRPGG